MNAIEVTRLSKHYRIHTAFRDNPRSLRSALSRRARHALYSASPFHTPPLEVKDFAALNDVSFTIGQGEKVALLGHNGSGKTTLLRIINRITMPSSGSVTIRGSLSCLLQAGTGFHPELSGRENLFMNGMVMGMSKPEVVRKFDEIVAFSGVEEFIDMPVKHYSTGMQARLGFSVAAHLSCDIMLIDEGLGAGDAEFRQKSINKIKELSGQGRTIVLVSHDMATIRDICTRAITLDHGRLAGDTRL